MDRLTLGGRLQQRFRHLFWRLRSSLPVWVEETPLANISPPVLVAGTGGSGTRVVTEVAAVAGLFVGKDLNLFNDSLQTVRFADAWIAPSLAADHALAGEQYQRMAGDLHKALAKHRVGIPDRRGRWVVKNPRLMLILPLFYRVFPDMKFVHVVRDGRDMALSGNQLQLRDFESFILDEPLLRELLPVRSIAFWSRTNLAAASFGRLHLKKNYCCVRFEDLCREPVREVDRLLHFLEAGMQHGGLAASAVHPPSSLGRWKRQPAGLLAKLHEAGAPGLAYFGYLD